MPQNAGYIIIFDEPRRSDQLLNLITHRGYFSEALSIEDWKMKSHQLCILSFDGKTITHVAIAEKGFGFVSFKSRINFKYIMEFNPVSIEDIVQRIGHRFRSHFINVSSGVGGRVPLKTWNEFKSVIKLLNKDAFNSIESLENKMNDKPHYSIGCSEILAQEKDALGLSLNIFNEGLRSKILPYWNSNAEGGVAPFIKGLQRSELVEDTMIIHDNRVFGDWDFIKNLPILSTVMFGKNGHTLSVCNANRTPIEKTLGVDLIYYHEAYESFVLVQYKRMTYENNQSNKCIYRPQNDKNYMTEIGKMNKFQEEFKNISYGNSLIGFRLHETPFFFKICHPTIFDPLSSDMIKGMYFPITLWEILLNSDAVKGPKGGIGISYERARRWINNTEFVEMVQKGWIGSVPEVSRYISRIIEELLSQNHSVTLAYAAEA